MKIFSLQSDGVFHIQELMIFHHQYNEEVHK